MTDEAQEAARQAAFNALFEDHSLSPAQARELPGDDRDAR